MTGHLSRVAIVLDHPKDVVNIGGVIRVMKNFGLSDLRLVNPDEFDAYRLEGIAHRTRDVIDAATTFESLDDAFGRTRCGEPLAPELTAERVAARRLRRTSSSRVELGQEKTLSTRRAGAISFAARLGRLSISFVL